MLEVIKFLPIANSPFLRRFPPWRFINFKREIGGKCSVFQSMNRWRIFWTVQPIHTLKFSVFKIVDFKMVNANPESGIISPLVFYGFGINKGIWNSHYFQPMFSNDEICWNKKFVFSWIGTARNDTLTFWILIWHFFLFNILTKDVKKVWSF